jgi:hypothetical protein
MTTGWLVVIGVNGAWQWVQKLAPAIATAPHVAQTTLCGMADGLGSPHDGQNRPSTTSCCPQRAQNIRFPSRFQRD